MKDQQHERQALAKELARILQADVTWGEREQPLTFEGENLPSALKDERGHTFIPVFGQQGLWVSASLTEREQHLLASLLEARLGECISTEGREPKQRLIRWLREVEAGRASLRPPLPEGFTFEARIPFYVVQQRRQQPERDAEIGQALESFFAGQVWVLPMQEDHSLILPLASLIYAEDDAEEWREMLWHWAESLVDLFATELGMEVVVVVHPPVGVLEELGKAWVAIRQAFRLGHTLYPQRRVIATWNLVLERLLQSLSQEERQEFLEGVASESHSWWRDAEMRETLDAFFRLNLNVSETARQLFLHRNTLLYRLDKLKQETGRDVRQFEEALLIRLALCLTADAI